MNREIKFRAWDERTKSMCSNIHLVISRSKVYKNYRDFEDGIEFETTLMRYTGLKDTRGLEIYEGDIVELHFPLDLSDEWGVVEFHKGAFVLNFRNNNIEYDYLIEIIKRGCEVIGNIHKNPELLK